MGRAGCEPRALPRASGPDPDEEDWRIFQSLTRVELSGEETRLALTPDQRDAEEKSVFALHFHPEWVPVGLVEKRIKSAFPAAENLLIAPTQHNQLQGMGEFSGVEADAFAPGAKIKIQLLIHLKSDRLKRAGAFVSMIEKTFERRALQLFDYLEQTSRPDAKMKKDIEALGAGAEIRKAAATCAAKIAKMARESGAAGAPRAEMLKNRLLTDYIREKRGSLGAELTDRLTSYALSVKSLVKARLDPKRFPNARDLIEEARALGAGVVIPHPPRFWPALLEDLDADGWEVWNSSSPNDAVFLTGCLSRRGGSKRPLLAFMGDDTHMSSKIRPKTQSKEGAGNPEIGFQPWAQSEIKAALKAAGQSRERTMGEYLERIS